MGAGDRRGIVPSPVPAHPVRPLPLRPSRLTAALLAVAMSITACGAGDDEGTDATPSRTASAQPTASPSPSPSPSPEPDPVGTAPLTGEPVYDAAVLDRPVLAVKVENTRAARPQVGLEQADIVFEELVEGGVTRFIALFHSSVPETVGPVRSARLVDTEVLPSFDPVLAYSGAREEVTAALHRSGIVLLVDDGGDAFTRDPGRASSHDLMAHGPRVLEKAAARGGVPPADPVFTFAGSPPPGAVDCPAGSPDCGTSVDVKLSSVAIAGWRYDAADEVYRRSQNGEASTVVGDGRIGAANVVALGMDVGLGGCCDGAGSRFTVTDVIGEGPAVILRDGRRYPARWHKPAVSEDLQLLTEQGAPFPLAPGATWIHLAPERYLPG